MTLTTAQNWVKLKKLAKRNMITIPVIVVLFVITIAVMFLPAPIGLIIGILFGIVTFVLWILWMVSLVQQFGLFSKLDKSDKEEYKHLFTLLLFTVFIGFIFSFIVYASLPEGIPKSINDIDDNTVIGSNKVSTN